MEVKEVIRAPPGLERINEINEEPSKGKIDEVKHKIMPTYKIRKWMSLNELEDNLEKKEQECKSLQLNKGYTKLEVGKCRWDT